jgi:hypothetical protein
MLNHLSIFDLINMIKIKEETIKPLIVSSLINNKVCPISSCFD